MGQLVGAGFAEQETAPKPALAGAAQITSAESVCANQMKGNQRFIDGKTKTGEVVYYG
jgi:hypothetical protein